MKIIIAILINTFLFVANIHGQENFNLLSDFPQYNKSLNRFYDTIAPALLKNLSKNPIARFIPNYTMGQGGCLLSIEKDSLDKSKLITHCYSFKKIISNKKNVNIEEKSIYISSDLSNKIVKLFELAISKINNEKSSFGLDGITYMFVVRNSNGNLIIAESWSPEKGTTISKIITLCNELAVITNENQEFTNKVSKKTDKLIAELEK